MNRINRVIWIILDSVGMGALPDADAFGDVGSNTLGNISKAVGGLHIPNMRTLGLGNIDGMLHIEPVPKPIGAFARAMEMSNGKDTTIGHWEMVGIYSPERLPTYPNGFPDEIIEPFIEKAGIPGILGNCTASGTEIIKRLGREHILTRKPIVYTSADSVFQIACHEHIYPPEELYRMCTAAREILVGKHGVARVIARPFIGEHAADAAKVAGGYERTSNRRDFSLKPPGENLLSKLKGEGLDVIGIGKIEDIFAGEGITEAIHTNDNMHGMDVILTCMNRTGHGLIYTNLVEFDSKWGHRNDYKGYAKGLEAFDLRLGQLLDELKEDDLLIMNADHGCDPTTEGTDHTREYVPVLIYHKKIKGPVNLGTLRTFADIGQTIGDIFSIGRLPIGESFLEKIHIST